MKIFQNELFDPFHLLYIVISLLVTYLILHLAKKYVTKQNHKDNILLFFAISTFIIHLSPLWVSFFYHEDSVAVDNMLFPIYFCNLAMLMLLITALKRNRDTKWFKYLAVSTAYSGIIGSVVSLLYPDYYVSTNIGMSFGIFKSMLSHSTMLIGSFYLFSGNYIKVEEENTKIFAFGVLFYGFIGLIVNITFVLTGYSNPNAMYLVTSPIEEVPFLNGYVIAIIAISLVLLFNKVYIRLRDKKCESNKLRLKH